MKLPPATQNLAMAMRECKPAEREQMHECQVFYYRQFVRVRHDNPLVTDTAIAAGLHDAVDGRMANLIKRDPKKARRIACKAGCAGCCHVQVDITQPEARFLIKAAEAVQWPIDRARLHAQADGHDFHTLPLETRRCVFLGPGDVCMVYEARPIACRKYLVLDTAEFCDTVKHPGAKVANFVDVNAECLQSAAFHAFENGPMAQQLLEWLP